MYHSRLDKYKHYDPAVMDLGLVARQQEGPTAPVAAAEVITTDLPPLSSRGIALIAVDSVMITLVITWTTMRVFAKRFKGLSPLMVEDILCYIALLCYSGSVTGHIICNHSLAAVVMGGVGHHQKELSSFHVARYSKLSFFAQIIYGPVIGCVKLSILSMLKRVFFTRGFRIATYFVMFVAFCWMLMPILVALLVCSPIEFNWNRRAPGGRCGNKQIAYALVGVVDLVSDLLILALPMRMVFKLQIKTAHKVALASIFGFSVITMLFTAIRLYYIYGMDFTDPTYSTIIPTTIGSVQMGIAIMVASSPLLRPIFDRTVASWFCLSVASGNRPSQKGSGYIADSSHRSHHNNHGNELLTFGRGGGLGASAPKKHDSHHTPYHGGSSSHNRTAHHSDSEECLPPDGASSGLSDSGEGGWNYHGAAGRTRVHVSGAERYSRGSQEQGITVTKSTAVVTGTAH
ncbi:Satratoxin biosynthesis SC1 cluster protein 4 [Apiospora aurea]|uniref:Satratoxin biosynthesis SC1 cluster protein 4 n=1 Tax=Apiospora aurea TaxID=335848 RepID=A0ABR1PZK3_9PEZI